MSISLHTGLPGNGKTLYTIGFVKQWSEREGREVYYHGIADLTLPWNKLDDPKKWFLVPPGSIVVIDEAQQIYRNRSIRSDAPEHVTELETHRHLGIDLVLITQHPSLIDPAVRKLTQTHRHIVRIWGMQSATIHLWNGVKDNCDKQRADSEKSKFIFDKSLYGVYKSAEVHTMKRRIPMRVVFLLLVPLLLFAAAYVVYSIAVKPKKVAPVGTGPEAAAMSAASPGAAQERFDPVADARRYVYQNTPRVQHVQHTAPKYDELTKPQAVPVPAMCIKTKSACQCYSQQGTKMDVVGNACFDIAYNGYFQEFDPNGRDSESRRRQDTTVQPPSPPPVQAPQAVAFAHDPDAYKLAKK